MIEEYNNECKRMSKSFGQSSHEQSESSNMENLSINSINQNFLEEEVKGDYSLKELAIKC